MPTLVEDELDISGPDIMYALVLEDGRMWGEVAASFQVEDVEAVFSSERPNWHFLTRGRGGSKTSDIAGLCLSWLYADSRPRARGYVVASNVEQAGILIDAAAGFVARTPVLEERIHVENERIRNVENDAWIRVLSLSDSGAWGLRDTHFLICDEFAQWPETRGAKRVYSAIRSTVQKTPGCRLVLLTSAGEPAHWSRSILDKAYADEANWRVHEVPGPVPWQSETDLEALRRELTPSEYERLVLNRWTSADDRAISEEDYERAVERTAMRWGSAPAGIKGGGFRLHHPKPGVRYVQTVDVGVSNDATVLVVAHKEAMGPEDRRGPSRVVVDHIERWQGSKRKRIEIDTIRDRVAQLAVEYNHAPVYADPDQFVGSLQQLRRKGVRAKEWVFSATSVGQVATSLVQVFGNGQILLPDYPELRDELLRVRLRSNTPGVTRLDHEKGAHDDQAVCIGMAAHLLLGPDAFGPTSAYREMVERTRERRAEKVKGDPRAERVIHHHQRMLARRATAADTARARQQRSCEHRWRAEPPHACAWGCGAMRDQQSA